jgi:hypothetical protein
MLYHAYSCLRDDGGGNLLLTLLSKTDGSGSMIFKSDKCYGHQRWSAPSFCPIQEWTLLAMWMGKLSSWKSASLLGSNILTRMHLVASTPTGSNLTIQSNYRTSRIQRYCYPNRNRSASMKPTNFKVIHPIVRHTPQTGVWIRYHSSRGLNFITILHHLSITLRSPQHTVE